MARQTGRRMTVPSDADSDSAQNAGGSASGCRGYCSHSEWNHGIARLVANHSIDHNNKSKRQGCTELEANNGSCNRQEERKH